MLKKPVHVDEAYDSPPLWYDIRGLGILWLTYKSSLRAQIQFFSQFKKGSHHLEVAIGSGSLFRLVYIYSFLKRNLPEKVVGFDYAPSMLAGARNIFKGSKNIELLVADATKLDFKNASFDSAHLANAVHCIPDYPKALSEIHRVLKPGGLFFVNVLLPPTGFLAGLSDRINKWGTKKGILQAPIDESEFIQNLEETGFEVEGAHRQGNCLFVKACKVA